MALSLETANKVRQKVAAAVSDKRGTTQGTGDPSAQYIFKSFFLNSAANKDNPDLQFVPITAAGITATTGEDHGIDAACKVYGIYLKKPATSTAAYYALFDDATNDCGGATDARISVGLQNGSEFIGVYPNGLSLTAGVVSASYTDFDGTTKSSSADAPSGFLVIGA